MNQILPRLRELSPPGAAALRHRRFPYVLLLLIPSWASYLAFERPASGADSPFFFHIQDLSNDPLAMLPGFVVGPLLNTELDQTLLVTGQVLLFGIVVERRIGTVPTFALFWATSIIAATGAALIVHGAYGIAPDAEAVDRAWNRAYGGGSAAGFGLMGVFAATSRLPLLWIGVFTAWEASVWLLVLQNFTPAFHATAFYAAFLFAWYYWRPRFPTPPA
jgi:hypothetical protein